MRSTGISGLQIDDALGKLSVIRSSLALPTLQEYDGRLIYSYHHSQLLPPVTGYKLQGLSCKQRRPILTIQEVRAETAPWLLPQGAAVLKHPGDQQVVDKPLNGTCSQ